MHIHESSSFLNICFSSELAKFLFLKKNIYSLVYFGYEDSSNCMNLAIHNLERHRRAINFGYKFKFFKNYLM